MKLFCHSASLCALTSSQQGDLQARGRSSRHWLWQPGPCPHLGIITVGAVDDLRRHVDGCAHTGLGCPRVGLVLQEQSSSIRPVAVRWLTRAPGRRDDPVQTYGLSNEAPGHAHYVLCRPRGQHCYGSWPWESGLASTEPLEPGSCPCDSNCRAASAAKLQPATQTATQASPWRSQSRRSSAAGVCRCCSRGTARGSPASGHGWQPPAGVHRLAEGVSNRCPCHA